MIGKVPRLFKIGIIDIILINSLYRPLSVGGHGPLRGYITNTNSGEICPTNNNSVCIKGYLHLVQCFKNLTENQENFSFAFFPNNKANSLYVTVTYTINYEQPENDSYDTTDNRLGHYIEQWVWSHTVVYIMYHPTIFKFLSIGYGMIDERINSVELTVPRLCHDNKDNYKLIERLTQMLQYFSVSLKWDSNKDDYRGRSFKISEIEKKLGPAMKMTIAIVYLLGYTVLRGVPYIMKHLDNKIEKSIKSKSESFGMLSLIFVCNLHSLLILISTAYSYHIYMSGYYINHTYNYFHHILPYLYLADPLFTVLVLIFGAFNVKWKYHIKRKELSIGIKKYIITISFTLLAVLYAIHGIFILLALIAEPLTVLSFGLFVSAMVAYSHMATSMVLLRMRRILKPHYTKTWVLIKQLYHGLKVVIYFLAVFTLTIMIRWLLLEHLTAIEYKNALTSISLSGLVSIVTLSLKYSLKWSQDSQIGSAMNNDMYMEFKDEENDCSHNMAVKKLKYRCSTHFRHSNKFSEIELSPLTSDVTFSNSLDSKETEV